MGRTTTVRAAGIEPGAQKRGKVKTGGNTKPDQIWLAEVAAELHEPDISNRPHSFLYDVQYQWEGYCDELNLEFFESFRRGTRECTGTAYVRDETGMYVIDPDWNKLRRPCLAPPMNGSKVCQAHGGKIPGVKAAAERALAEASEVVALRLLDLTGPEIEDVKTRLAAINSVLDRVGIKGGVDIEVQLPGYKKVMADLFGDDSSAAE